MMLKKGLRFDSDKDYDTNHKEQLEFHHLEKEDPRMAGEKEIERDRPFQFHEYDNKDNRDFNEVEANRFHIPDKTYSEYNRKEVSEDAKK